MDKAKPDYSNEKFLSFLEEQFPSTNFTNLDDLANLYSLRIDNLKFKYYSHRYKAYFERAYDTAMGLAETLKEPPQFSEN